LSHAQSGGGREERDSPETGKGCFDGVHSFHHSLHIFSKLAKGEGKRLDAGVEKLDLERAVVNCVLLADELVQAVFRIALPSGAGPSTRCRSRA
jgi:hypothetical protein